MSISHTTQLLVAALFLLPLFSACDKSDSGSNPDIVSIADLMPRENEISGWASSSGSDGSWKATNPSELQDAINGGSELYTNHGFVEAAMQSYSGTVNTQSGVACEIQIYDQGSNFSLARVKVLSNIEGHIDYTIIHFRYRQPHQSLDLIFGCSRYTMIPLSY